MNYCTSCGGKVFKESNTKYTCEVCTLSHYINPKGAIGVFIITESDKLVMAVRAIDPHKGKLDCLGGFLDVGESFEQALYREVEEESGIKKDQLKEVTYLTSVYDDYPWGDIVVPVTSVYFVAKLKPGASPTPSDDVADIKIMSTSEISAEDFAWDGMRQAYQALLALNIVS